MHLSIVIPTLNEAKYIQHTLTTLKSHLTGKCKTEIILVDAGSTDGTVRLVQNEVDQCIVDNELAGAKYLSLNEGAAIAKGEVLLFLDADCEVERGYDKSITDAIESKNVVAGAFKFRMNDRRWPYGLIEWLNHVRYSLTKHYFGDQGLFCKKIVFDEVGGFPEQPILEAGYLCKRLRQKGKLVTLNKTVVSSVRRFEQGGIWTVFLKDAWIYFQFLLGFEVGRYAKGYWTENIERGKG